MCDVCHPYQERFPKGSKVRVADAAALDGFRRTWRFHHELLPEMLAFADRPAVVIDVSYYHGGAVLYRLNAAPEYVWHEACLRSIAAEGRDVVSE